MTSPSTLINQDGLIRNTMYDAVVHGVRLFNARKFFEAHEALEAVWLETAGEEKTFLHGLIQVAAAFHHQSRGNPAGFRSLLEKGIKKLEPFGAGKGGVDIARLLGQLEPWREYLHQAWRAVAKSPPPLPRISRTVTSGK